MGGRVIARPFARNLVRKPMLARDVIFDVTYAYVLPRRREQQQLQQFDGCCVTSSGRAAASRNLF